MNLKDMINLAMSGCVHEFHVADTEAVNRHSLLTCNQCGVEATAGEVAWMLAGGQAVRTSWEAEVQAREQLMVLAEMPAAGGVN